MRPLERLRRDAVVLGRMLRGMPHRAAHAERLQSFYAPQAAHYDEFRDRLLPGRAELVERLPLPEAARVVELGGGTARNAEFFGPRLARIAELTVVDLCPALLDVARARAGRLANLRVVEADATTYRPDAPVDCVYFSYALTMIPDWRGALANAWSMLKPGGAIGAVDFYVPEAAGTRRVGRLQRAFWRSWFAHDGVRLDPAHLANLCGTFPQHTLDERRARVPYLPGLRVPYYLFVGRKPEAS